MYEFEVNHKSFKTSDIGDDIVSKFTSNKNNFEAIAIIPWEEHCTECAMPQCYETCDLYAPRKDGKCRRFHYGFGYASAPSVLGFLVKVSFKRWAAVMSYANIHMVPIDRALRTIAAVTAVDRVVSKIPDSKLKISGRAGITSRLMRRAKQTLVHSKLFAESPCLPDCLYLEIFNPREDRVQLSLVIRDADGDLHNFPYQELLVLPSGYNQIRIPFNTIAGHIDASRQFHITLNPNLLEPEEEGLILYFGLMTFVKEVISEKMSVSTSAEYKPVELHDGSKHVKVIAWDLDNTLWEGILVEDGEESLKLREGIVEVIRELDRRGIVNSIVSKNDLAIVLPVIQDMGVSEYFVFPQVSWGPKSQSVSNIIKTFNVGSDTIAVIDDSPFERAEISELCSGVRVYTEKEYLRILDYPEFRPPLSDESARRREFYRAEENRTKQSHIFKDNYLGFLRGCEMFAFIHRANMENISRVHELTQRTNQLNFSGNRYDFKKIEEIITDKDLLPLCITCNDRFGEYGLVGFCLLDIASATITDLMFSCRVQAKRVEHAILMRIMEHLRTLGASELRIRYKKTTKNAQASKVFEDLNFQLNECVDDQNLYIYGYDLLGVMPTQDVVRVRWEV